jgi:hypothetical protein
MAIQLSVAVRNARLDAIESTIGTAAILRIYTGSPPADCATAATGTLLAEMTLASDWMNAASSGQKTKLGTWQDASANGTGTAGYFRIWDSGGTTCGLQGTVTATSGGGDMELDNTSIATAQQVTITTFTLTDANA